jgi:hypothetical protein
MGRAFYHHGAVDILMQGDQPAVEPAKKAGGEAGGTSPPF